ncbi:uncharacterized protein [Polyergus mexicanus]|uniref:uncharacterized protein isoform X2 n=1 Tax=Polyergus mexicanus TaxID=615972 RepID=UPI0038B614BF
MTFADLDKPLRTDESFQNQDQPIHHQGYSPLLIVESKMVSQFRLDAMHLVYSGVFKRLLMAWLEWKGHYLNARKGAKGFEENSAYETEKELGKGKRKRFCKIIRTDSDSDIEIQKKNIYLQPASCSKIKEKGFTNNLDSSTSDGNQKYILNVNVMSNNPICQHLSNANTNLKSIPDSDIMQSDTVQNLVRKQSLLCSVNLNSNNSIDSVKIPTCEDSTSKNIVKQKISINNSKKKNLTVLEKVRSKLNLYKQSYENKQRTVPQVNSAKVSNSFEETNFI